ncbi:DUF2333 family protein [Biformimicrobium ophioploci]|uniref:DUF2333 family protein n=1 Tax=Biformimicrobium ophioploci TaxID=3036711 RepID=A0ABQ6LUH1_9GAMM|nr:DUF2333 family protein [Microbulbifer sp. NKW57]GMG85702.1 DUF2333 family protein [Microbulbifer sp. NKW57]
MTALSDLRQRMVAWWRDLRVNAGAGRYFLAGIAAYLLLAALLGIYWSMTPAQFDVREHTAQRAEASGQQVVIGSTTTATLIGLAETLLDKPGGYLSNDRTPPGVWLDNMENWEFGVLIQVRDFAKVMRDRFSRSQSQSREDNALRTADARFNTDRHKWLFPDAEGEYRVGIENLEDYLARLADPQQSSAQFYARADNLRDWLGTVESRLGSISQRLSASVGKMQINIDLAGDADATQSTAAPQEQLVKTPWTEIDDVFFEARGTTWALLHLLKAVETDFATVLQKKNAVVSLRQIIRELEATQDTVMSPVILNGDGFGPLANHSLVMASYISRAHAALIDLRDLLARG